MQIYALYDTKVEAFMNPFFLRSDGEAKRSIGHAVMSRQSGHLSLYPHDFVLFRMGEFEEKTGEFLIDRPESLGVASSFATQKDWVSPDDTAEEAPPDEVGDVA
jgi:hypothetical protein